MENNPTIIVIGNEKGGAGKTTTAMHLIASLLYFNFKVVSIDTDVRQASLTRYMTNRVKTVEELKLDLPISTHYLISQSKKNTTEEMSAEEGNELKQIIESEKEKNDFFIIDTPGSNSYLSQLAHSYADIIITPINDSFVDMDLLAEVNGKDLSVVKPGIYSQMIWEQKMARAKRDRKSIEWIILRNRISAVEAKNKRNIEKVLQQLANRIGCRIAPGFGERVIFRELFLKGITLLDLKNTELNFNFTTSHIIARQELLGLLQSLNLDLVNKNIDRVGI